jgi:hypothetical protein
MAAARVVNAFFDAHILAEDGEGDDNDDPVQHRAVVQRFRRGAQDAAAMALEPGAYVPRDNMPWALACHDTTRSRALTEDDPRAETPPGFKGRLFPPQATVLWAMIALERSPVLTLGARRTAQTRCGRVNAAPAFGKTVLALALVCAQPAPTKLPEMAPLSTIAIAGGASAGVNRAVANSTPGAAYDAGCAGFMPELTVRYERWLPATMVVAANNVISQWENETRRFTDKRFFTVENVRTLREFETLFRAGGLNAYDLVFVKAGRVTARYRVDGEPPDERANRSLLGAVAAVLEGVPVARLIVDDYDTLKLAGDDCTLPAFFTWFISATRRRTAARVLAPPHCGDVAEYLRAVTCGAFPILGAALDDVLNGTFSLNCEPRYVADHISSCVVAYRRIRVRGGRAAVVLRALGVAEDVIEMVNADAVGTAAAALGVAATGVGDVIRRVVGRELGRLRAALRIRGAVRAAREAIAGLHGPKTTDPDVVKELRDVIKDGGDVGAALAAVTGGSPALTEMLDKLAARADEDYARHGATLSRMRDNVREGICQCCTVPFDRGSPAYVLAGCCQIIVCEDCISRPVGAGALREFLPRCPNCARAVRPSRDLVRAGGELDLERALADETAAVEEAAADEPAAPVAVPVVAAPEPAVAPVAAEPENADRMEPKERALVTLIRGGAVDCLADEVVAPYVHGMLEGRRDSPWPAALPKKYIVFTMHPESTRNLQRALDAAGIRYVNLRGSRDNKDQAVAALRGDVHVLLVTAAKDCAGLNLPFASTCVFYHRVLDRNVETQVAARGQRLGRLHNYEVVAIHNEAEVEEGGV